MFQEAFARWGRCQNPKASQCCAETRGLVGRDGLGRNILVLEEPAQKLHGRRGVPALPDQDVEHLALLVDSAPQPQALFLDADHDFIRAPAPRRRSAPPPDIGRDQRHEMVDPATDGLITDLDTTLSQQFFDVAKAQSELKMPPNCRLDHVRRKSVTLERQWSRPIPLRDPILVATGETLPRD